MTKKSIVQKPETKHKSQSLLFIFQIIFENKCYCETAVIKIEIIHLNLNLLFVIKFLKTSFVAYFYIHSRVFQLASNEFIGKKKSNIFFNLLFH